MLYSYQIPRFFQKSETNSRIAHKGTYVVDGGHFLNNLHANLGRLTPYGYEDLLISAKTNFFIFTHVLVLSLYIFQIRAVQHNKLCCKSFSRFFLFKIIKYITFAIRDKKSKSCVFHK